MSDCAEIAITSDTSEQLWSCCVWDVRTGTHLMSYKGGGAPGAHTLATVGRKYIITGNMVKPMLHLWPVNRHEPVATRFILTGRPTALAASPDGNYCVVAVQETLYVYSLPTGMMLATIPRHYQTVNVLKFVDDGSHFVSAGQDGMVVVWSLTQVVRIFQKKSPTALYSFSDHALPVTDIYIGAGGMRASLCTVSVDRSCKIYDLASGKLSLNVVFHDALSAVTMDALEANVFVGTNDGHIYVFSIQSPPRTQEYHVDKRQLQKNVFIGHKKQVTCLSVSVDGETLISGGADECVLVWHIKSRQQLRTIPHKGAVTNATFMLTPSVMFDQEVKLPVGFPPFQKLVLNSDNVEELTIDVMVGEDVRDDTTELEQRTMNGTVKQRKPERNNEIDETAKLRQEVLQLKAANKAMYETCIKAMLQQS